MAHEHDEGTQDEQGEGRLTDEVLEEKLRKGPLPFIPGGEKSDPPVAPEAENESSPGQAEEHRNQGLVEEPE